MIHNLWLLQDPVDGDKDDNDNEKQVSIKSAYDCNGLGNKENDIKHEEVKEDDDGRSGGNKVVVWYGAQGYTACCNNT